VWFTGLLVVAGFLTAFVVGWQSWETHKAAQSASVSASAAINAQRSWVMASVEDISVKDWLLTPRANVEVMPISCIIKNYGEKPVMLKSGSFEALVVESLSGLPIQPFYGKHKPFAGQVPLLPQASGPNLRVADLISLVDFGEVIAGRKHVFAFGFVAYTDGFGIARESRFGFLFAGNPPTFQHGGPSAYNDYT
jgi:hypothetical protein